MNGRPLRLVGTALLAVTALAAPARAFDSGQTFTKGTAVVSAESGYGAQFDLEGKRTQSDLEFFGLGVRFSVLTSQKSRMLEAE